MSQKPPNQIRKSYFSTLSSSALVVRQAGSMFHSHSLCWLADRQCNIARCFPWGYTSSVDIIISPKTHPYTKLHLSLCVSWLKNIAYKQQHKCKNDKSTRISCLQLLALGRLLLGEFAIGTFAKTGSYMMGWLQFIYMLYILHLGQPYTCFGRPLGHYSSVVIHFAVVVVNRY